MILPNVIKYIKIIILVIVYVLTGTATAAAQSYPAGSVVDVWCIGNANYPDNSSFTSYKGINFSAATLLEHSPWKRHILLLTSTARQRLNKQVILNMISKGISSTLSRDHKFHTILIYYCGHGVADLSGGTYWVPGDIQAAPEDTTFEFLAKKLLDVDEIIQQITTAQEKYPGRSRFILLSDCCSNRVSSKWYRGIRFNFRSLNEGTVVYDSVFIKNKDSLNSALSASAALTFDDLNKPTPKPGDKPSINEFGFIPEMIRYQTFISSGNLVFYSSKMGEETAMVDDPDPRQIDFEIGPIARRALIYFRRQGTPTIEGLINFLTGPEDKNVTNPILINRTRD